MTFRDAVGLMSFCDGYTFGATRGVRVRAGGVLTAHRKATGPKSESASCKTIVTTYGFSRRKSSVAACTTS